MWVHPLPCPFRIFRGAGPIAGISVGMVDGELILNPNAEQRHKSDLNLTVCGTEEKVCMLECGANEVDNDTMMEAIIKGHQEVQKMCRFIAEIRLRSASPSSALNPRNWITICSRL